ncbi:MAG: hypothetical protein DRK00_07830, partial [Thermoprotei archaeon]
ISQEMVRMSSDLMKNASGVCFLLFTALFTCLLLTRGSRASAIAAIASGYLAFLTHSLDYAYALLYMASQGLAAYCLARDRHRTRVWLISLTTLISASLLTTLALPQYFSDLWKGVAFLEDLLRIGRPTQPPPTPPPAAHPSPPPLPPLQLALPLSFLVAGCLLLAESLQRGAEALVISSSLAAGALSLTPALLGLREWGWRFALMDLVPVALIAGVLVSRAGGRLAQLAISTVIVGLVVGQAITQAYQVRPSIPYEAYLDLLEIRHLIPLNAPYALHCRGVSKYWPEYVLGWPPGGQPRYVISDRPLLGGPALRLVYRGRLLWLYEVRLRG